MARARNALQGTPPFCSKCRGAGAHVVSRVPGDPSKGVRWLCGSCEYLELNPVAVEGEPPTLETIKAKALPLQKEKLF